MFRFCCAFAILSVLFLSVGDSSAVPAPTPKPVIIPDLKKSDLAGCWTLTWGTAKYYLLFQPDGVYYCRAFDVATPEWLGYWDVKAQSVVVREVLLEPGVDLLNTPNESFQVWTMNLGPVKKGSFDRAGEAGYGPNREIKILIQRPLSF